ncbi:MAG: hypothetical protein JXA22_03175 [Candidatus Thermoplasmatota archaeon]|nr:hypothetical protein [Candidatus Thermoplasmatota archaeon]
MIGGLQGTDIFSQITFSHHSSHMTDPKCSMAEPSDSTWDNDEGKGNYWSDHGGEDTDDDGIGKNDLPNANVDYYPLIQNYY